MYDKMVSHYMRMKRAILKSSAQGSKAQHEYEMLHKRQFLTYIFARLESLKKELQSSAQQLESLELKSEVDEETKESLRRNVAEKNEENEQAESRHIILEANTHEIREKLSANEDLHEKLKQFYEVDLKNREKTLRETVRQFKKEVLKRMNTTSKVKREKDDTDQLVDTLNSDIDDLEERKLNYKRQITVTETELGGLVAGNLHAEVSKLKLELKKMQKTNVRLQETINNQQIERGDYQLQVKNNLFLKKRVQVEMKRIAAQISSIRNRESEVQKQAAEYVSAGRETINASESLKSKVSMFKQRIETLKASTRGLSRVYSKQQSDLNILRDRIEGMSRNGGKLLEEISRLESELRKQKNEVIDLKEVNESLTRKNREAGRITSGVDALLAVSAEKERILEDDKLSLLNLQRTLQEKLSETGRIVSVIQEKLLVYERKIVIQNSLIKVKGVEIADIEKWIQNFRASTSKVGSANDNLRERSKKIVATLDKAEVITYGLSDKVEELVGIIRSKEKHLLVLNDSLRLESHKANEMRKERDNRLSGTKGTLLAYQAKRNMIEVLHHEIEKNSNLKCELKGNKESLMRSRECLSKKMEHMTREAAQLQDELEEMDSHLDIVISELRTSKMAGVDMEMQVKQVRANLSDLKRTIDSLTEKGLSVKIDELQDLNNKTQLRLRAAGEKRRRLEVADSEVRETDEVIKREVKSNKRRYSVLSERLERVLDKIDSSKDKLDFLSKEIKSVQATIQETVPKSVISRNFTSRQQLELVEEDKRLKALIAEISILSATLEALEARRTELSEIIETTHSEISQGRPPPYEAIRESRIRTSSYFDNSHEVDPEEDDDGFRILPNGTRTTAPARPNVYTLDGLSTPIPFRYLPMKPQKSKTIKKGNN